MSANAPLVASLALGNRLPPRPISGNRRRSNVSMGLAQCLSAGGAAGIACSIFHPLDCLRVRWQLVPRYNPAAASGGLARYGVDVLRNEGLWGGLWKPGLVANAGGVILSAAFRFGCYEYIRDAVVSMSAGGFSQTDLSATAGKSGSHMAVAGLISGAIGSAVSTPFQLLKTKMQAATVAGNYRSPEGTWAYVCHLIREGGFLGLWKGVAPLTLKGSIFTAGQMMGYDGLKTFLKAHGFTDCPSLHLLASIASSFGASLVSAPADLICARYMSGSGGTTGILMCARSVYEKHGVFGFWRGWSVCFLRLTPVMLVYAPLYEEFRFLLGLDYLS